MIYIFVYFSLLENPFEGSIYSFWQDYFLDISVFISILRYYFSTLLLLLLSSIPIVFDLVFVNCSGYGIPVFFFTSQMKKAKTKPMSLHSCTCVVWLISVTDCKTEHSSSSHKSLWSCLWLLSRPHMWSIKY